MFEFYRLIMEVVLFRLGGGGFRHAPSADREICAQIPDQD